MSKERSDCGDSVSASGMRFRNQSPSSQRQSRERDRHGGSSGAERIKKHRGGTDMDTNIMPIGSSAAGAINEMTTDHNDGIEESRLSGMKKSKK